MHGDPDMKIYTASITPAGLRTAGEVSDGTLPIWFSPEQADQVVQPILDGRAKAGKPRDLEGFDLAPYVKISMGNDLAACRDALRPNLALYIGGMGARSKNFYNDFAVRLGYEEAAAKIQDLYLGGHKKDAEALVPDKLIDEIALVGSADRIKDRLQAWKQVAKGGKTDHDGADRRLGRGVARGGGGGAVARPCPASICRTLPAANGRSSRDSFASTAGACTMWTRAPVTRSCCCMATQPGVFFIASLSRH